MISRMLSLRRRAGRTKLRAPLDWYQHLGLESNDVFLASFPRSGSTWLRFQLYQVITGQLAIFENVDRDIPEVGDHRNINGMLPGGGRLLKTHQPFRREYKRAVYLVRDVRDVLVSYYYYQVERMYAGQREFGTLDDYLMAFVKGKVSQFRSWQDHLTSWLESPVAENGNLLIVRYEDLRAEPAAKIAEILRFLGVSMDPQRINNAVENNSLQCMRAKEDLTTILHKGAGENGRFVRKGTVGGWREELNTRQLEVIRQHAGQMMVRMGYEASGFVAGSFSAD